MTFKKRQYTFTKEHRANLSKALKGRIVSEATKQKIRETMKGPHPWNIGAKAWNKGKPHSSHTREKMSTAMKAYWNSRKCKKHGYQT